MAAYMQAREKLVREDQVRFEQLHIVRKELKKCFWAEGTNYNTVCNDLAVLYLRMLRASKVRTRSDIASLLSCRRCSELVRPWCTARKWPADRKDQEEVVVRRGSRVERNGSEENRGTGDHGLLVGHGWLTDCLPTLVRVVTTPGQWCSSIQASSERRVNPIRSWVYLRALCGLSGLTANEQTSLSQPDPLCHAVCPQSPWRAPSPHSLNG